MRKFIVVAFSVVAFFAVVIDGSFESAMALAFYVAILSYWYGG